MQTRELCSGSVLQERAAGASSLVCTGLNTRVLRVEGKLSRVRNNSNKDNSYKNISKRNWLIQYLENKQIINFKILVCVLLLVQGTLQAPRSGFLSGGLVCEN